MTDAQLAQVRAILRNIEAMGQPYPNFTMVNPPRLLHAEPAPDDRRMLLSGIGWGVSGFFGAASVALFLVNTNLLNVNL